MAKDSAQNFEDDLNVADTLRKCVSCAVLIVDGKSITQFTPDAAALTGISVENALNAKLDVLPKGLQKILQETISSGQPASVQMRLRPPGQHEVSLQVATTPVQNGTQITGAIAVLSDFGCAEKLEQNFRRVDQLASIGTLSASMAHEIKNALVAVKTFIDLLLSRNPEDELADVVGREMTRIDSIVSQMLTFSGPAKPVLSPLRLHDVLNHSLKLIQHQLGQKNITLERSFNAASDLVRGDDYQLKQAFLNLLFNALEATPMNGKLVVATDLIDANPELAAALREKDLKQMRVTIRDSGVGIAPEDLARVFEPFFTTKAKGTGLGLPITRRIINEHRGTMSVESVPGEGSTFSIVFPTPRKGY